MDSGKRMIELEAVSNWLEEENRSLVARVEVLKRIANLKGEVMAMKDREEAWSKAEEKCRDLESEKGKLEMDLKAAMAENKVLRRALQEKDARITALVNKKEQYEHILRAVGEMQKELKEYKELARQMAEGIHKVQEMLGVLEAKLIKMEKQLSRRLKTTTKANEKKITEFVQRIEMLEEENFALKAEKMTVKEEGDKKILELGHKVDMLDKEKQRLEEEMMQRIAEKMTLREEGDKKILELGHKVDMLDKEKQRLEEELMQRIDVIKVLVEEKECLDGKLQQLKTVINNWTLSVKLEDNADLPKNNLRISGNPGQSQDKQSAKRTRPST